MITKEQKLVLGSKGYDLVFEWKGNIHAFKSESLSSWSKEKWCKFREETGLTAVCAKDGNWMFYDPEQYDVDGWVYYIGNNEKPDQPINCGDYAYMFTKYRGASLDLSHWDVSEAISFFSMFFNCKNLKSLNVNNWDVNQCKHFELMFSECSQLRSLNLSNWKVSPEAIFTGMFSECTSLQSLKVKSWCINNSINCREMFRGSGLEKYYGVHADKLVRLLKVGKSFEETTPVKSSTLF